ncbi:hypothetical protein FOCC_FOCC015481 [Frankliniella occidentalis]|nr:hypothetical protein FOCC_FOCC015481 [Frankliniella occidentalis]
MGKGLGFLLQPVAADVVQRSRYLHCCLILDFHLCFQDIVNHQGDLQCKLSVGFVLASFLKICHTVFGFRYRCPVRTSSLRLLHVASQFKEASQDAALRHVQSF